MDNFVQYMAFLLSCDNDKKKTAVNRKIICRLTITLFTCKLHVAVGVGFGRMPAFRLR